MDSKSLIVVGLLSIGVLGGCAIHKPVVLPDQPQSQQPPLPSQQSRAADEPPLVVEPPERPRIDTMADVPGDKPLPALLGAVERIDCMHGVEDLHARIAIEARGGRVSGFAYYSKWKPRTCAFDFARTTAGTKWRLTPEGATRVHTPQGRFLIHTTTDAYIFEFEQVERRPFCGMSGEINGTMTIRRKAAKPADCSVVGIMDANDTYLEALRLSK